MSRMSSKEDFLIQNVDDLRKRLMDTERSLQSLSQIESESDGTIEIEPSRATGKKRGSNPYPHIPPLSLNVSPDDNYRPLSQVSASTSSLILGASHSHHDRRQPPRYSTPREKRSMCSQMSLSASSIEVDNETLRHKLQSLREENMNMVVQNHKLLNEAENLEFELGRAKTQITYLQEELEKKSSDTKKVLDLQEKLLNLESEVEVQDTALRDAEIRCEDNHRQWDEARHDVERLDTDVKRLKLELAEEIELHQRTERQKNEALAGIDELQTSFQSYQRKVKDRLRKHQSNEEALHENLGKVKHERDELNLKVSSLDAQVSDLREEVRRYQDETSSEQERKSDLQQHNLDLNAQVKSQTQKIGKLQNQLLDYNALKGENEALKTTIRHQTEQLDQCQRNIEKSHAQLSRLERWIQQMTAEHSKGPRLSTRSNDSGIHGTKTGSRSQSPAAPFTSFSSSEGSPDSARTTVTELKMKLAMKDMEIQQLHSRLSSFSLQDGTELNGNLSRSQADIEQIKELEKTARQLEQERGTLRSRVSSLESRLEELDTTCRDMNYKLKHRNSDVSELQRELSAKNGEVFNLERELRRKTNQLSSLERQLDEKANDVADHVKKLDSVEEELNKKTGEVTSLRRQADERNHEVIEAKAMAEKMKQLHKEQCQDYEKQIEIFMKKVDERTDQLKEAESLLRTVRNEMMIKDSHVQQLKDQLSETKQHVTSNNEASSERLKELEGRAGEATKQVEQLECVLVVCKEELRMYLQQMDDMRGKYEADIERKSQQVSDLEQQVTHYQTEVKSQSLHLTELERALDERQEMLQQSAARIGDLEDREAYSENQVSKLEVELTKSQNKSLLEIQTTEHKLHQACLDIEERGDQIKELMTLVKTVQSEKNQLTSQLEEMKVMLTKGKTDLEEKESEVTKLEGELRDVRKQLDLKTEAVTDLEEKLHKMEADLQQQIQMNKDFEVELKKVQVEMMQTVNQLQELQQLLTMSQTEVKQRDLEITGLRETVRLNETELTHRTSELEEMDQVLKERQWELEQRAAQVSQLDLTIREHRSDMEQQVMRLEGMLVQRQAELDQRAKEIEKFTENVSHLHHDMLEKDSALKMAQADVKRLEAEVESSRTIIGQLRKESQQFTTSYDDLKTRNLELNQELRITREQMQLQHLEVTETRKEMAGCKREQERYAQEVDEAIAIAQSKEADSNRLAEELGAKRAREAQLESRMAAEVRRLKHEMDLLREQHAKEINNLREDHSKIISSKDELASQHRLHVKDLKETMQTLTCQLESSRDHVMQIEHELEGRRDVIDAANESIVIKEAEIIRLEAKISGFERAALNLRSVQPWRQTEREATHTERCLPRMKRSTSDLGIKSHVEDSDMDETNYASFHPAQSSPRKFPEGILKSSSQKQSRIPISDSRETERRNSRPPRSNVSGVFTASESESEGDMFQSMLRQVNRNIYRDHHQTAPRGVEARQNHHSTLTDDPGDNRSTHSMNSNTNNHATHPFQNGHQLSHPPSQPYQNGHSTASSYNDDPEMTTVSSIEESLDDTSTVSEGTPTVTATCTASEEERVTLDDHDQYDTSETSYSTDSTIETQIQFHK